MKKLGYTYWKSEEDWLGHLDEYPDYWTQGKTEEELKSNLVDLYRDLSGGLVPYVRKHAELEFA